MYDVKRGKINQFFERFRNLQARLYFLFNWTTYFFSIILSSCTMRRIIHTVSLTVNSTVDHAYFYTSFHHRTNGVSYRRESRFTSIFVSSGHNTIDEYSTSDRDRCLSWICHDRDRRLLIKAPVRLVRFPERVVKRRRFANS